MNNRKRKKPRNFTPQKVIIDDDDDEDDCILISIKEPGECSRAATSRKGFYCTICTETVPAARRFPIAGCAHAYCARCVEHYVTAKVEGNLLHVGCPEPGCNDGELHPEACRYVIRQKVFDRWGAALCEEALGALRFYCPFRDCSALLVNDQTLTNVACPHCRRMFCAQCKVPWHDGVNCAEFQRLGQDERGREDLLLRKVAQERRWQRCPWCKMYVERISGCSSMICRCGNYFCYKCGSAPCRCGRY